MKRRTAAPPEHSARGQGLRFLVADDDASFREAVRAALEVRGFVVVAEAADAPAAIEAAIRERPDICLVDLAMPGEGLTAVAEIAKRVRHTLVIVLTGSDRSSDVRSAIALGASGYLLKGMSGYELATVLEEAFRGRAAFSPALVPRLIEALNRGVRRRLVLPTGAVSFTAREWDVAELLREGWPSKKIAAQLGVSPITARKHVASVVRKLAAHDRGTATQMLRIFGS